MAKSELLSAELLEQVFEKAAEFDATGEFPSSDVALLQEAGYLKALAPKELGGLGFSLSEVLHWHRKLAMAAPATALSVAMHQVVALMALAAHNRADSKLDWILSEMTAGEFYALAVSEFGNEAHLFGSISTANETKAGYEITAQKSFITAAPAWSRVLMQAKLAGQEKILFAIANRDDSVSQAGQWQTFGQRATQSYSQKFEGTQVPQDRVVTIVEPGEPSEGAVKDIAFGFSMFTASGYLGIGQRALEIAAEQISKLEQMSAQAVLRNQLGEAITKIDLAVAASNFYAQQFEQNLPLEDQQRQVAGLKVQAVLAAKEAVAVAQAALSGQWYREGSELSRLLRDLGAADMQPYSPRAAYSRAAASYLD